MRLVQKVLNLQKQSKKLLKDFLEKDNGIS